MAACYTLPSCSLAYCVVPASSVHTRSSVSTSLLCSRNASWQVPLAEPWQSCLDGSQFHQCTPLAADGRYFRT
ncbi:rCG36809, isoform CRA_a [Rattus norvegicus]|uniref:RCG36809, isoform CRA_a n=1 Tax=Rattus norvegicus TaxID=10116 RepID=A6JSG2_RAT|nr:rCG36809, isoform CRA_a [Rattus norvegicus]